MNIQCLSRWRRAVDCLLYAVVVVNSSKLTTILIAKKYADESAIFMIRAEQTRGKIKISTISTNQ